MQQMGTLRVLMLSPHPGVRGPLPRFLSVLVEELRAQGCHVATISWGKRSDDESLLAKVPHLMSDINAIRRWLERHRVDAVVIETSLEWMSLLRNLPLVVALGDRAPRAILQFHGGRTDLLTDPRHRAFRGMTRQLLGRVDGVLVSSTEEQRELERFEPGAEIRVVNNPYVSSRRHSVNHPEDGPDPPSLLYASRLIPEKGVLDLVDAVALLNSDRPVRLVIAGAGPAEQMVEDRVRAFGLQHVVTLTGHLDRDALNDALADADIFVLPTYWVEGFPTAITEAMDAGLPIVTTPLRGMVDHLEEGTNAVFVPPRNPIALHAAILRLLQAPKERVRMGQANQRKVAEFAPGPVARQYLTALREILLSSKRI